MATITTKFDIGDTVFRVFDNSIQQIKINDIHINFHQAYIEPEIIYDCRYKISNNVEEKYVFNENQFETAFASLDEALNQLKINLMCEE